MQKENCRLCGAPAEFRGNQESRVFFSCPTCHSLFVSEGQLPTPSDERRRYEQHRNDRTPAYEDFLNRLVTPLAPKLVPSAHGLDFGCGPVPVLSTLLAERGFRMTSYDPIFFPNRAAVKTTYDFVTCSETAEHFHCPWLEFERLDALTRHGGHIALMTQMRDDWDGFTDWYYVRDPTHVMFYTPGTMAWIGRRFRWRPEFHPKGVVIFEKTSPA